MTTIKYPISQEKFVLIDEEDLLKINKWKWSWSNGKVVRRYRIGKRSLNKGVTVLMHRFLLGIEDQTKEVDHINGNPLDNRKENLRIVTHYQNSLNTKKRTDNTSGYKGVSYTNDKWRKLRWLAQITVQGKHIHLGRFLTSEEADIAYRMAADKYFGEFANYER